MYKLNRLLDDMLTWKPVGQFSRHDRVKRCHKRKFATPSKEDNSQTPLLSHKAKWSEAGNRCPQIRNP